MTANKSFKNTALAILFLALTANAHGAITGLADAPLVTGSDTAVLPNLMFVLDDSGSMDWDYMPDTAKNFSGKYGFNSSHCNGTYYNPNTTYTAPVKSDGTSYPDATFTAAWKDGYQTGLGTVNLATSFTGGSGSGSSGISLTPVPAFYYTYTGTQTSAAQMNYQSTTGTFYTECNSAIGAAPGSSVFTKTTLSSSSATSSTTITVAGGSGAASGATITITAANSYKAGGITVGGAQIMSGRSSSSSSTSGVATNIAAKINNCTAAIPSGSACTVSGYSASVTGSVVTITGPAAGGSTLTITDNSGSWSKTTTAFPAITATVVSGITVNGIQLMSASSTGSTSTSTVATNIAARISLNGYSATASGSVVTITGPSSASTYTPVITKTGDMTLTTSAFPATTSAAQLQNFANWYSYYSNRMLMMKTGAGLAFSPIGDNYRVGFLTMNNNVSPGIVEAAPFAGGCAVGSGTCQRDKWYTKLYASNPGNSTPLREALSHVGQYYAHKFGNVTYYKSTLTVGGSGSTDVDSITVNGTEIMNDISVASTSTSTVAANIAAQINLLDTYGASVSGSVVTINGTVADLGQVPSISKTGGMTVTPTAFVASTTTSTLNGILPADPMQYSCQQNFTILSTDGYWNGSTTYDLNGSAVGQQDGTEQRPMLDGASSTSTVTTPYTTVKTEGVVTSGATTTKTWSKTTTTLGAACSIAAATVINKVTTLSSRNRQMKLGTSSSNPNSTTPSLCYNLAANAWFCRSDSDGGAIAVSNSEITDSAGTTWSLVDGVSANTNCVTAYAAFGSISGNNFSTSKGACGATSAVAGSNVITTPYTQTEVISGATTTVTNIYTAAQATSHVVTNGVAGAESSLAPASLSYTLDSTSSVSTGATSDTCGGQSAPCPSDAGTWTAGTATTVCTATASLPTPGTTSPTSTTNNSGGTTVTNVISTVGPTAGVPTASATTTTGGVSNTLADVAEYYYVTDLRDSSLGNCTGALGTSVCGNNVPSTGLDAASWQHMTTFTLGLGARGRMVYSPTYLTDTSGDFFSVKNGVTANGSTICSWLSSGTCNWPTPASSSINNIDDLWHAAVNGRGSYFSATDPVTLASGISSALAGISTRSGASAAATTSNPNVTSGDNFVFSSTFTTTQWDGELVRQQLDLTTGATSSTNDWCANGAEFKTVNGVTTANCPHPYALDALAALTAKAASRTIYAYDSTNANGNYLKAFNETNFGANAYFNIPHISTSPNGLTQMLCASASICASGSWQASRSYLVGERFYHPTTNVVYQVATAYPSAATFGAADTTNASVVANPGNDLVNFLRGDRTHEGAETDNTKYYRSRAHILGDIVNAEAVYVKSPLFNYTDAGYTTSGSGFVTIKTNRQGMVYAAANDGMLHAFYAGDGTMDPATGLTPGATSVTGGNEAWAYIPSKMLPNLYKLADKGYGATGHHRYFVDGTPVVGDICPTAPTTACTGAQWKTILVGGFNKGGRGYYALDITNPAAPKALWEFTDDNLGYTYGNPKITKLTNGTWVVMVTSGYNNVPNADGANGDGVGHLFVINAATGVLIKQISTGVGDTTTPSGLAHIAVRVYNSTTNNTAKAVYGGDMLGNLWRFDVSSNSENIAAADYNASADIGGPGNDAQLLTTLIGPVDALSTPPCPAGCAQPITTKPELGDIDGTKVIYVGTGRYLGPDDSADHSKQSIYAIEDPLTVGTVASTALYANPRTLGTFKNQTPTSTTCPNGSLTTICTVGQIVRTSPNLTVTWGTDHGFYMDLPDTGERANTDPTLSLGTLGFTTNVPNTDACTVGGYSYRYFMDYKTGGAVSTSTTGVVGAKLGNALATRPVYVRLPNGVVVELTRLSTGVTATSQVPIGSGSAATRRTSWRELIEE